MSERKVETGHGTLALEHLDVRLDEPTLSYELTRAGKQPETQAKVGRTANVQGWVAVNEQRSLTAGR